MKDAHFVRSHGLGNDYIVLDDPPFPITPASVKLICDRNFGVGSDGVLLRTESGVRIFNPDGSEAEKSGNGVRIFAKYLFDEGIARGSEIPLDTLGGHVTARIVEADGGRARVISVAMGKASFPGPEELEVDGQRFAVTSVSVGNPHCIVVVDDVERVDLPRLGPLIERHPAYPNRTNVQFAQVLSRGRARIVIWERGAGVTLASGSSSCAVAAALHRLGLIDPAVTVEMPGGELRIEISPDGEIQMTGQVEEVCRGTLSAEMLRRLRAAA